MLSLLYRLKRSHGYPVDIYTTTTDVLPNFWTGEVGVTKTRLHVNYALVLTAVGLGRGNVALAEMLRLVENSTGSKYPAGNGYSTVKTVFVVDKRDLPVTYKAQLTDYLVHNGSRYKIDAIAEPANTFIYHFDCTELLGEELGQVLELDLKEIVHVTDGGVRVP